jgi:hypothetical protein
MVVQAARASEKQSAVACTGLSSVSVVVPGTVDVEAGIVLKARTCLALTVPIG